MNAGKSAAVSRHLAVHMGAMGDFLLVWPALLSLARSCGQAARFWAGKPLHAQWAAAAGWPQAPAPLRAGVEALYAAAAWPPVLQHAAVTWFGLRSRPMEIEDTRLHYIPCIQEGGYASPRTVARQALEAAGVPWAEDWREVWRGAFGGWQPQGAFAHELLLFPGAGHRAKHWGLVQFFELAGLFMQEQGGRVAFVLGPAEVERGMEPLAALPSWWRWEPPELLRPTSLQELSAHLLRARRVLGNDCGPMHLASMHGVPGVVLFGPTARRQWAPEGLAALAGALSCRPCTLTTAGIQCDDVACMRAIAPRQAWESLHAL